MHHPSYSHIPSPDYHAIQDSLNWTMDPSLPALLNETYQAVIMNRDDNKPYVVVAYEELSRIVGYKKRLTIARKLKDRLLEYLQSRYVEGDELKQREKEFDSLIHYLRVLDDACSANKELYQLYERLSNHPIQTIDRVIYYNMFKRTDYQDEFLWFSQLHYFYAHHPEIAPAPASFPIYTYTFKDKILATPAVNFCISLLSAQNYLNKIYGKGLDIPLTTVKNFNLNLRNYCFDKYIEVKGEEEQIILMKDNERDEEPTLYDGELELLKKEVQNYKDAKEQQIDDEVMRMTAFFIKRLRKELGFEDPKEEIDPSSEELNIPNENNDIDRRIRTIYKTKGLIRYKADWGAVFKIHVEEDLCKDTDYAAFAERVNFVCTGGKKVVTTPDAIRQSPALYIIRGKWTGEGWRDGVKSRKSAGLLLRYEKIAQAYSK